MHVVIAGGHGKIALRLAALLSAHGDEVRSLIRNPEHEPDVRETGAQAVLCDLEAAGEEEMAECVGRADAVALDGGRGDGSVPRDDVAEVVHAALHGRAAVGRAFDLASGQTPIEEAVAKLAD
jgi:nucleoside-diphosphate-sugar epimerase